MTKRATRRIVWTLVISTALALLGDATLYAVLPASHRRLGLSALQVGWLLSVNRLVRPPINMLSGWLANIVGTRRLYLSGVGLGALSTLGYGLVDSFAALVALRGLWGVSWALLVVSAYGMVLDSTTPDDRGRYTGLYASFSFFGGAIGAMLGGVMVDVLGYAPGMRILGGLTALGWLLALTLPTVGHVRGRQGLPDGLAAWRRSLRGAFRRLGNLDARLWLILGLNVAHRFFFAGVFYSTFGLYLAEAFGETMTLGRWALGLVSLTAALLFVRNLVTILVGPLLGALSDRLGDRRRVLLVGEAMGLAAFAVMALPPEPWRVGLGVLLAATAYGVVPPMLVSWMGDLTRQGRRGAIIGGYQTMGDIGSGLGPLAAYALVDALAGAGGVRAAYLLSGACLAATIPLIVRLGRGSSRAESPGAATGETIDGADGAI